MSPATPQTPSLSGFAEAQDRKRLLMGSVITFLWDTVYTYDPSVPVSELTGAPYDPTASATASAQASASAQCGVFFKAINRGGAANANEAVAIGNEEITRVFLTVASADAPRLAGASQFIFHGDLFSIFATKLDEIVSGYVRYLVYGAFEGSDDGAGAR